jgi:hypothetical protein
MAKKSRGRAPRYKKPSLKLPGWPCTPQAASDTPTTATVPTCRVGAGPRLQEGDQEAREEALTITGVWYEAGTKPNHSGLVREAFKASSTRKRSVRRARKWIDAFKLSTNCELIDGCAMTSRRAARVSLASRWRT